MRVSRDTGGDLRREASIGRWHEDYVVWQLQVAKLVYDLQRVREELDDQLEDLDQHADDIRAARLSAPSSVKLGGRADYAVLKRRHQQLLANARRLLESLEQ
jgi:hypothetical protein